MPGTGPQGQDSDGATGRAPTMPPTAPSPVEPGSLSYGEASRELDAIVGFFESSEVDVDQLVVKLQRATELVDELDRRIRATSLQVESLVPRLTAVGRPEPDDDPGLDAGPQPEG